MFRVAQLGHDLQPFAVVYRPTNGTGEQTWRFFETFADADLYRQRAMAAEDSGMYVCNGCLKSFRSASNISRHVAGCEGAR